MRAGAKVGLIGCGSWGRFILRDLIALGCTVSVVAPSAESRARAEAAQAVVDSISELPDVDGIVVGDADLDPRRGDRGGAWTRQCRSSSRSR